MVDPMLTPGVEAAGWTQTPASRLDSILSVEPEPDPQRKSPREVQALADMTDIEHECRHGALPLDGKKPEGCDCWTQARTRALARLTETSPW
jgi:hypothetical protein